MKKMMLISSYKAPYGGNFISSLKILQKKIRSLGIDIIYAFPKGAYNYQWCQELGENNKVIFIDEPNEVSIIKLIKQIKEAIKKEKIDIVYSHFTGYDLACYFAVNKEQKMFIHMHNPINNTVENSALKRLKEKLKYFLYNKKVNIIACAEHIQEYIIKQGSKKEKCTYVLNGIDIKRITDNMKCKSLLESEKKAILMHGWDPFRKGVDTAIKACSELEDIILYITYVDKKNMDDFFQKEYNGVVPKFVKLLPAVENVMEYLKGVDIFISPSRAEGSPYALMEAIMAGVPSIGSNLPGLNWQKDIPALWTIEVDDNIELLNRIKSILELQLAKKEYLVNKSKHIIENKHSVECWAEEVIEYIKLNAIELR